MNKTLRAHLPRLIGGAALLLAGLAHAQYAWIDEKGVRHFSDRPPPPSTPATKILKAPGKPSAAELLQDASAAPPPAAAAKVDAKPSLAEREADYRKRTQAQTKETEKQAEQAQQKQAQLENCENARRYKALLDSGVRVADTAADGGRTFLSDEERARRLAQSNAVLAGCR